jgi:RluA family pseudouridine synthase
MAAMPEPGFTTLSSTVKGGHAHNSLLDYLCARFPYRDREGWKAEINLHRLTVNGKPGRPSTQLGKGDSVSYSAPRKEPEVARDIITLFEDADLLVVDKPAPLPVHADGVFITNTLINILRERTKNPDLSLGHRLDRETSGVLVLAKTRGLTAKLMRGFEESGVQKTYLAVVRGEVPWKDQDARGWMLPKADSKVSIRQWLSPEKSPEGKDSFTRFQRLELLNGFSLLSCTPLTGRTNQIRVHLEALGFPLAGDKLYGRTDDEFIDYIAHMKKGGSQSGGGPWEAPRHLLHAWKLGLRHPVTGEMMRWEAPLRGDMLGFVEAHRR